MFFFPSVSPAEIYYEENEYPGDRGFDHYGPERSNYRKAEAMFPPYVEDEPIKYHKKHYERYESRRHDSRVKKITNQYEISGSPYATENAPVPENIKPPAEKLILINPNRHAWGAYTEEGRLIRWGIATSGSNWCRDLGRSCRTKAGSFRIYTLGDESCISSKFPLGEGGAPMPYCMFFNSGQALHGSNEVVSGNVSHGCVRLHVSEAKWLRYHFVEAPNINNHFRGTKVVVVPY
jgi:lipoprotein-anchoring transpeptidase ErfK/SrfK